MPREPVSSAFAAMHHASERQIGPHPGRIQAARRLAICQVLARFVAEVCISSHYETGLIAVCRRTREADDRHRLSIRQV